MIGSFWCFVSEDGLPFEDFVRVDDEIMVVDSSDCVEIFDHNGEQVIVRVEERSLEFDRYALLGLR